MSRPMGTHLLECAGNNNPANFGLMSVAAWDGVPLVDLLSRLQPRPRRPRCSSRGSTTKAALGGLGRRRGLGPAARGARSPRRLSRAAHQRPAAAARSRHARAPGRSWLVRMRVDQVGHWHPAGWSGGARDQPDEGIRRADAPDGAARAREGLAPPEFRPPRCRSGSSSGGPLTASPTASSASPGAATGQPIGWRFGSARTIRGGRSRCAGPAPPTARLDPLGVSVAAAGAQAFTASGSASRSLRPAASARQRLLHPAGHHRAALTGRVLPAVAAAA